MSSLKKNETGNIASSDDQEKEIILDPESFCKSVPIKRKKYSSNEVDTLILLIRKYRDSVNRKSHIGNQKIWDNITAEFNSQFPDSEPTSIKQLRKLWDNLKTRHKDELLLEQVELCDGKRPTTITLSNMDNNILMKHKTDCSLTLPIETVVVENDFSELPSEEEMVKLIDAKSYHNSINSDFDSNFSEHEVELREKKLRLSLCEEENLYKLKKAEQILKNEIASVQLRMLKEKEIYLNRKRELKLHILEQQFNSSNNYEERNDIKPSRINTTTDTGLNASEYTMISEIDIQRLDSVNDYN